MERNQTVFSFGRMVIFLLSSGSLQCVQEVPLEDVRTSWNLDPFSLDEIQPFGYRLLGFIPHCAVKVCLPEEVCESW